MIELQTERLLLRQWRAEDFEPFARAQADPETAQFIGGVCDRHEAWRRLAALIGHWVLRGYGYWAVTDKATGTFAGCVGLWFPEGWPELEMGYWLTPDAQGKGYATEAGAASVKFAFEVLGANTLVSYIHLDNERSVPVSERLGGCMESTINLLDFGPHRVFRYAGRDARPTGQA